jgi:hypothetical protein
MFNPLALQPKLVRDWRLIAENFAGTGTGWISAGVPGGDTGFAVGGQVCCTDQEG